MKKIAEYWTHLRPEDFVPMPWKNGRGTTVQIAVAPVGAALDGPGLSWRLSLAPVTDAGPFSLFPGFDRTLAVVEGRGLRLDVEGIQPAPLLRTGDIYSFPGEKKVSAELTAGPIKDLGLLCRRGAAAGKMTVFDFNKRIRSFQLTARTVFFYAVTGTYSVECFPGGAAVSLKPGETLRVDDCQEERITVFEPNQALGMVVAVEINW